VPIFAILWQIWGTTAKLEILARIYIAYGFLTQPVHVFVATHLTQLDAQPEHEEQDIIRRAFSWSEFDQMVSQGQIIDAQTLAALSLLRLKRPDLAAYSCTLPDL